MAILGVSIGRDVAKAQHALAKAADSGGFQKILKSVGKDLLNTVVNDTVSQASGSSGSSASGSSASMNTATGKKELRAKLNEAVAVGLVAPILSEGIGQVGQRYFANSPAEQAYSKQLYTELLTRVGQSGKLPLARDLANAMLQRMQATQQASTGSGSSTTGTTTSGSSGSSTSGGSTGSGA